MPEDMRASLFGLAPAGVYPATAVTGSAVRSYRTFSPLPPGLGRGRRSVFCGTFRGLAPPRRYLAACPVEPGLSSIAKGDSGYPAVSRREHRMVERFFQAAQVGQGRAVTYPTTSRSAPSPRPSPPRGRERLRSVARRLGKGARRRAQRQTVIVGHAALCPTYAPFAAPFTRTLRSVASSRGLAFQPSRRKYQGWALLLSTR